MTDTRASVGRDVGTAYIPVGVGSMPPELERFNWNALIWGGLWAFVYGIWPWVLAFVGLLVVQLVFYWWFRSLAISDMPVVGALAAVASRALLSVIPTFVFAQRANRLLWERGIPDVPARRRAGTTTVTVGQFVCTQRRWLLIGMVLWVVSIAWSAATFESRPVSPGWFIGGLVGNVLFLAVVAAMALRDPYRHRG
ncbi:MAG: hypothetical protein U1E22_01560 [Coriobacteriia bacterium]|nr:hypothetical protein [Coriobacteriia bacterium]